MVDNQGSQVENARPSNITEAIQKAEAAFTRHIDVGAGDDGVGLGLRATVKTGHEDAASRKSYHQQADEIAEKLARQNLKDATQKVKP